MSAADLEQSRRRVLKAAAGQPWAGDLALLLAELDRLRAGELEAARLLRAAYADAHSEAVPLDVLRWLNPNPDDADLEVVPYDAEPDAERIAGGEGPCALCHGTHYYSQPMVAVPGKTVNTICPYCGPPPRPDTDPSGAEREVRRLELAPVPDESPVVLELATAEPDATAAFEVVDMDVGEVAGEFTLWTAAKLAAARYATEADAEPGRFLVRPSGWAKQHKMDARQR